ncbi:hypothetical protein ID866_6698, partial [Astraeus odoratus]
HHSNTSYTCSQDLHARVDEYRRAIGTWGTLQIATPIAVGVGLVLCFAAYVVWQRRRQVADDAHLTRQDQPWGTFVGKFGRLLSPRGRRTRYRVTRSSGLVTLDESMDSPCTRPDHQRRSRQYSADSTDSSTPLTGFPPSRDYPPNVVQSDAPARNARRLSQQFLRMLGFGPQEVKSASPSTNWRIDVSSTGHGHDANERENREEQAALNVDPELGEEDADIPDRVIQIGNENFSSIASTDNERGRAVVTPATPYVPETGPFTPRELTLKLKSTPNLAVSRRNGGGIHPPEYNPPADSSTTHQSRRHGNHMRGPSTEDFVRAEVQPSDPQMLYPASVRATGYGSPFGHHDRQMSSESLLASQTPMTLPSAY